MAENFVTYIDTMSKNCSKQIETEKSKLQVIKDYGENIDSFYKKRMKTITSSEKTEYNRTVSMLNSLCTNLSNVVSALKTLVNNYSAANQAKLETYMKKCKPLIYLSLKTNSFAYNGTTYILTLYGFLEYICDISYNTYDSTNSTTDLKIDDDGHPYIEIPNTAATTDEIKYKTSDDLTSKIESITYSDTSHTLSEKSNIFNIVRMYNVLYSAYSSIYNNYSSYIDEYNTLFCDEDSGIPYIRKTAEEGKNISKDEVASALIKNKSSYGLDQYIYTEKISTENYSSDEKFSKIVDYALTLLQSTISKSKVTAETKLDDAKGISEIDNKDNILELKDSSTSIGKLTVYAFDDNYYSKDETYENGNASTVYLSDYANIAFGSGSLMGAGWGEPDEYSTSETRTSDVDDISDDKLYEYIYNYVISTASGEKVIDITSVIKYMPETYEEFITYVSATKNV